MSFFSSKLWLITIMTFILFSCNDEPGQAVSTGHMVGGDTVMNYHRGITGVENQEINDFIKRYGWKMSETPTGLRYLIYKKGSGKKAAKEKVAVCRYTLKLLNGQTIYSSVKQGLKEFRIGHAMVENGLEEGILIMREGDRAKFIVPSHLAFGLLGDQNKIPPGATLVYDIELVKLK